MTSFIMLLLACSVSMSIVSLIWMGVLPVLAKRYKAKWLYRICLLLIIGWMIPFRPVIDFSFISMQIPERLVVPVQIDQQLANNAAVVLQATGKTISETAEEAASIPLWWVISVIWMMGFFIYIVIHGLRHRRLTKMVRRWGEPVTDANVLEIAEQLKQQLNIQKPISLKVCSGITSPMLMGLRKPVIVLPSFDIPEDELALILKHEFVHFLRHDLWCKAVVMVAAALHWFNPVMHLMSRTTAEQCEISCDAQVLRDADFHQRKLYGEAIIGMMRKQMTPGTAVSTYFYGGKKGMNARIFSIMDTRKKKEGAILFGIVLIAIIGAGAVFAANSITATENNEAFDKQVVEEIIGPLSVKQEITVAYDALQVNEFVAIGGPFTIQEGDIIQYNLQGEGDGHLNVHFRQTADPNDHEGYLGYSGLMGNHVKNAGSHKVSARLAGAYYLWIGNFDGKSLDKGNSSGVLDNITGTVSIAVDEGDKHKQSNEQALESLEAPEVGGFITTSDGQNLSVSIKGKGYNNFAELPFKKGETFTMWITSKEERELEIGLLSISTEQEYGEVIKTGTGEVSITIPEDGDYRVYIRNHDSRSADFELQLSQAIEGPIV